MRTQTLRNKKVVLMPPDPIPSFRIVPAHVGPMTTDGNTFGRPLVEPLGALRGYGREG